MARQEVPEGPFDWQTAERCAAYPPSGEIVHVFHISSDISYLHGIGCGILAISIASM